MANRVKWITHECEVNQHDANWYEVPGIYIFAGVNQAQEWYPLYVGQAKSLAARIPSHEVWPEAQRLGATHVHAMVARDEDLRCSIEEQLIRAFQPRLNTHHR
jgi:excinuclease UvrABC nuclease subunit